MSIAAAFIEACLEELAAPKPGNVHIHAPGHRMTVEDFVRSAEVSAPLLCRPGAPLGRRILEAATATREAVGQNTNLGILLLCGPLAMAAEARAAGSTAPSVMAGEGPPSTPLPRPGPQGVDGPPTRTMTVERQCPAPGDRMPPGQCVRHIIAASDLADADAVFAAIRLASPAGLGSAERHDVREPATVTLPEAMAEAAGRDSIARQWSNGFTEILGLGVATYSAARASGAEPPDASLAVYLAFLSAFPDSHVARKHGAAVASKLRHEAARTAADIEGLDKPLPKLLAWDAELKSAGINPGTSADLTVATSFAWRLGLHSASIDG
nr:triphosphoribosyl-dephospho-CoA synthase [uncultured Rhodopila sp.]